MPQPKRTGRVRGGWDCVGEIGRGPIGREQMKRNFSFNAGAGSDEVNGEVRLLGFVSADKMVAIAVRAFMIFTGRIKWRRVLLHATGSGSSAL